MKQDRTHNASFDTHSPYKVCKLASAQSRMSHVLQSTVLRGVLVVVGCPQLLGPPEAIQHTLRSTPGCKVNAFLLVPGFTATKIITRGQKWLQGDAFDPAKATDEECYEGVVDRASAADRFHARGAYSADEVVDVLFEALRTGGPFYIICQDHETTLQQDQGRMQWAFDDVLFRRSPLSRWSEQYKDEFKAVAAGFR